MSGANPYILYTRQKGSEELIEMLETMLEMFQAQLRCVILSVTDDQQEKNIQSYFKTHHS